MCFVCVVLCVVWVGFCVLCLIVIGLPLFSVCLHKTFLTKSTRVCVCVSVCVVVFFVLLCCGVDLYGLFVVWLRELCGLCAVF